VAGDAGLDAGRIAVSGGSYGGYMTLAVSFHYADKIRCAIDSVGISNFVSFLQNTEPYRQDLRRAEYGDERDPEMRDFLLKIAPLTNVAKIKKPLFVIQGANDPRVPRSEAEQMVGALETQGTPVWYLLAKDEGHGFAKKKNYEFQFYTSIAFVKKYLLN
jgi:dipeptidyl aminopeptidase/acylaminoacyl peptidase